MKSKQQAFDARVAVWKFGLTERSNFYANMAAFIEEGMTPTTALQQMQKVAVKRRRLRSFSLILKSVLRSMEGEERSVGAALRGWVPPVEASMVVAGETSGTLGDAFKELAWVTGEQARISALMKKSMIPMGLLLVAAIGLMYYVVALVTPQAVAMISPEVVGTLIVAPHYIRFGEMVVDWGWLFALLLLGIVTAALASLPRWAGRFRSRLDGWALPWSVYAWTQAAFFLASVSAMLKTGLVMRDALGEMNRHASPWQRWHIRKVLRGLDSGLTEVQALDTGMLPEILMDQLLMYSALPSFPAVMRAMARDSIKMYENIVESLAERVKLAVMLGLVLFVLATFGSLGEIALAVEDAAQSSRQNVD